MSNPRLSCAAHPLAAHEAQPISPATRAIGARTPLQILTHFLLVGGRQRPTQ